MISASEFPRINDRFVDGQGVLTKAWYNFFRMIGDVIRYIGYEQVFVLVNNQAVVASIPGLKFDKSYTSAVFIEYFIQRIHTAESAQTGVLIATYKALAGTWSIREYGTSGPDAAGITFTITTAGQVQYTSSNLAGTQVLSRIVFRTREIAAKAYYSKAG